MKVKELIQKLQELPEDSEICLYTNGESCYDTTISNVNDVEIDDGFITESEEYYSSQYYEPEDFDGAYIKTYAIVL